MIGRIFAINRLIIGVDGPGITTLVGMYKCPLNCEFCINNPILTYREYTVEKLYDIVKVDHLYFEYCGGGICFGGHEPLLQQEFIIAFIKYVRAKGYHWKFGLETSLNCILRDELLDLLDYVYVDIKDMNSEIYKRYTEKDNDVVLSNLKKLVTYDQLDILIRIPKIPRYNDESDIEKSKEKLRQIGFQEKQFDVFEYVSFL